MDELGSAAIGLVIDRSGSMWSVADDTRGGVKQFIANQKQKEGKATLSLVQFDHEYEVLHDFADLSAVDEDAFANQYAPRGTTALLDAIGRCVIEMSQKIEKMDPAERPARVVVAIVTDGQENASRDFTVAKIQSLIAAKKESGWNFVFLGAHLHSISAARQYGFDAGEVAYYSSSNVREALNTVENQVNRARKGRKVGISDEERARLTDQKGGVLSRIQKLF